MTLNPGFRHCERSEAISIRLDLKTRLHSEARKDELMIHGSVNLTDHAAQTATGFFQLGQIRRMNFESQRFDVLNRTAL